MSDVPTPSAKPTKRERARSRDVRVFRDYFDTLWQPEFRPIFLSVLIVLFIGTMVFHELEDWSLLNSLYFSVVTLATIGYGDLHPTNDASKLFAILYIFIGVGTLGVFISAVSRASLRRSLDRKEQRTGMKLTPAQQAEEQEDL